MNSHACGVRRALPFLGKPVDVAALVAMADAYQRMLVLLDRHVASIAKVQPCSASVREEGPPAALADGGDPVGDDLPPASGVEDPVRLAKRIKAQTLIARERREVVSDDGLSVTWGLNPRRTT